MKKLTQLIIISTLAISSVAIAKPNPNPNSQGGFCGDSPRSGQPMMNHMKDDRGGLVAATTIAQAKQLTDDAWVVLTGNITKQIGKDKYTFKDKTGEIDVQIDRKQWRGLAVTPKDVIEIAGEIDKDWNSISVDVKSIKPVAPVAPQK